MNRRNFFGTVGAAIAGVVLGGGIKAQGAGANLEFASGRNLTVDGVGGFRLWKGTHGIERFIHAGDVGLSMSNPGCTLTIEDADGIVHTTYFPDGLPWTVAVDSGDRHEITTDDWYGAQGAPRL